MKFKGMLVTNMYFKYNIRLLKIYFNDFQLILNLVQVFVYL